MFDLFEIRTALWDNNNKRATRKPGIANPCLKGYQITYGYVCCTWKVLKCGAGEGWRRSVGPIM